MRKILLLSTVFALSFSVFAQNDAEAGWATTGLQIQQDNTNKKGFQDTQQTIVDNLELLFQNLKKELELQQEQDDTVDLANQANHNAIGTAVSGNARTGVQQNRFAVTATNYQNSAGQNCVIASGGKGTSKVTEGAESETEQLITERMKTINSEAGTDAENGLVDFQRKMFERSKALCDPAGNGGANTFCGGAGNAHVSLSTILTPLAFQNQPPLKDKLEYIQDLLFSRVPISVNPDLLEQPNTETMNMVVESDRLKAEMSVGQTLFSILQGNRTKVDSSVVNSIKQRLEAGGWSGQKIDNMTAGGISKNALYHALSVGSYTSEFMLQKASANERDLLANILAETQLNNVLQFEQYKLLEAIALATATNIVVNRDDAIKDLNNRISAANSR